MLRLMFHLPPVFPSTIAPAMAKPQKKSPKVPKLGVLPEWNLDDLYPGPDSPELKWDLENAETRCVAFEGDFKGKLAELAAGPEAGKALAAGPAL
jgi:oligoendopeptidase F